MATQGAGWGAALTLNGWLFPILRGGSSRCPSHRPPSEALTGPTFPLEGGRIAVLLFTALMLVTAAPATAAPTVRAAASDHAELYTFAFHDADVSLVADEILGKTLSLTFTVDPGVTGKMSFRIEKRLTRPQLLEAFEAALSTVDVVMVRQGDSIALMPRAKAKGAAGLRTTGVKGAHAGYEVVAVPLSYAAPSEVAKALESIGQPNIVVYQNDKLGLLLLGGDGREIEAATQTIRVFDRSGLEGARVRWFALEKAPALTVAGDLDKLLQTAGISGVSVVPMKRLNGLFVFARTPEALDRIGEWVKKFDEPSRDQGVALWVYHPRNTSADALGQTLNAVLSGRSNTTTASVAPQTSGAPASASQPATVQTSSFSTTDEDPVRVGVDKDSNTLLISASPSRWVQIQRILEEIDRIPSQILIEASILEVTLTDDFRFGVDWSVLSSNGKVKVVSSGNSSGAVAPSFPGIAVTFFDNNISAAVDALRSKAVVQVVSAPKIVVLDNHTAKLQIGDQVPVAVQSTQSTSAPGAPVVISTDYRSTGVLLTVTPRISGDDKMVIEVSQEVSSVAKTTTSGINSPTIQQRRFDSTLILTDGGTVALGGLIGTTKTTNSTGVPYLKDIPGVGALFRSDSKSSDRTELIVLLTARIMRDKVSTDRVMTDLMADMRDIENGDLVRTYIPKK